MLKVTAMQAAMHSHAHLLLWGTHMHMNCQVQGSQLVSCRLVLTADCCTHTQVEPGSASGTPCWLLDLLTQRRS